MKYAHTLHVTDESSDEFMTMVNNMGYIIFFLRVYDNKCKNRGVVIKEGSNTEV